MKTIILVMITLIGFLFVAVGFSKNNITFKLVGGILVVPFLLTLAIFILEMIIVNH